MAGQPIFTAAFKRLNLYGLEGILERVMNAETLKSIAADPAINVSRPLLSRWLCGTIKDRSEPEAHREERARMYEQARRFSAMCLEDDVLEQVDNEKDPRAAQLARNRAEFRLRLAEIRDRDRYGQLNKAPTVNINLGALHVDALRRRAYVAPAEPVASLPAGEVVVDVVAE